MEEVKDNTNKETIFNDVMFEGRQIISGEQIEDGQEYVAYEYDVMSFENLRKVPGDAPIFLYPSDYLAYLDLLKPETTKDSVKSVKNDGETSKSSEYHDENGKFKKGNPGGGRGKGRRDFKTDFFDAITKYANNTEDPIFSGKDPEEVIHDLMKEGVKAAKKGDFRFWNALFDRVYGKAVQPSEVEVTDVSTSNVSRRDLTPEQRKVLRKLGNEVLIAEGLEAYGD